MALEWYHGPASSPSFQNFENFAIFIDLSFGFIIDFEPILELAAQDMKLGSQKLFKDCNYLHITITTDPQVTADAKHHSYQFVIIILLLEMTTATTAADFHRLRKDYRMGYSDLRAKDFDLLLVTNIMKVILDCITGLDPI